MGTIETEHGRSTMTTVTLYHGTDEQGADSIRADGVIRAGRYYGGVTGVALTPRREVAEAFACDPITGDDGEVIEVEVPVSALVVDLECVDHDDVDHAIDNGESVYYTGGDLAIQ